MKKLLLILAIALTVLVPLCCKAQGSTTNPDFVAADAATVTMRNQYPVGLRKWGMLITVYADAIPANNKTYSLKYNYASISKADNNNWVDAATGLGIQSKYKGASPTTVTVGGLSSGSTILNRTYDSILQAVLVPYINPVFNSFSVTGQATTVEVGTTISGSKTFTWSIAPGSGTVPTIDIFDNTASSTLLAATPNDGTQAVTVATIQLNANAATQSWKGIGNNTSPAGTFNSSNFVVTARFFDFFGNTSSNSTTSAQVRALPQNVFHTGAFTNNLNTGSTNTIFEYACQCTISQVLDLDALNANITSQYVLSGTVNVNDAGGTPRSTNIYRMTVGSPYSSNHRHQITTSN